MHWPQPTTQSQITLLVVDVVVGAYVTRKRNTIVHWGPGFILCTSNPISSATADFTGHVISFVISICRCFLLAERIALSVSPQANASGARWLPNKPSLIEISTSRSGSWFLHWLDVLHYSGQGRGVAILSVCFRHLSCRSRIEQEEILSTTSMASTKDSQQENRSNRRTSECLCSDVASQ